MFLTFFIEYHHLDELTVKEVPVWSALQLMHE